MTPLVLAAADGRGSLCAMRELKYDHAIWQKIAAARDHALANPDAPRPDWMIGKPWTLSAFLFGYRYVVYHRNVPLRPLSYGGQGDIEVSLHLCVATMLDPSEFARARRPPFVTGQGTIRAVSFSDIIDNILKCRASKAKHGPSPPIPPAPLL